MATQKLSVKKDHKSMNKWSAKIRDHVRNLQYEMHVNEKVGVMIKLYHKNGQLKYEDKWYKCGNYKFHKTYHENGKLIEDVKYYESGCVKLQKIYHEDGLLKIGIMYYETGVNKLEEKYDESGKLIQKIKYNKEGQIIYDSQA